MKRNNRILFGLAFFSVIILSATSATAQDEVGEELKISIQVRPRAEIRNGLFTPILKKQDPASFISQRSRLGLYYSKNNNLKLGLSTQAVHTWGNDAQVQITANNISLYEAWAQVYFSKDWNLKLGRQILSYDDERILGALDWNNAGRKHDAALIGFEKKKVKASAGFAFNQNSERVTESFFDNKTSQPYKSMEFLWLRYDINPTLAFSVLGMNLGFQDHIDSSKSNLQTLGGNVYFSKKKLKATGTYYLQKGTANRINLPDMKTNAWMAAVYLTYNFHKKFNTTVGTDYLSGNDMSSNSITNTSFNPLYGTGHKFYGSMDYFYVSSPHNLVGLWDSYLKINFQPFEKFSGQIAFHHFESAGKITGYMNQNSLKALGNEIDLTLRYTIFNDVTISGGYSQMFVNKSMRYAKNIPVNEDLQANQNWAWVSINFNPKILIKTNQ